MNANTHAHTLDKSMIERYAGVKYKSDQDSVLIVQTTSRFALNLQTSFGLYADIPLIVQIFQKLLQIK